MDQGVLGIVLGVIVDLLRPLFLRAVFGPWLRRREVVAVKRR